jgi:hypothetical protein
VVKRKPFSADERDGRLAYVLAAALALFLTILISLSISSVVFAKLYFDAQVNSLADHVNGIGFDAAIFSIMIGVSIAILRCFVRNVLAYCLLAYSVSAFFLLSYSLIAAEQMGMTVTHGFVRTFSDGQITAAGVASSTMSVMVLTVAPLLARAALLPIRRHL